MICKFCKIKLKCQDSRQTDKYTRVREYGCPECNKVFMSLEQLDDKPLDREMQKVQAEQVRERIEREKQNA